MSVFSDKFEPYGPGQKTGLNGLNDDFLQKKLRHYKRTIAKRYRVVFVESIHKFLPEGPLFISTKIDGELWFLIKRSGEVALCAYNGRVLQGVPVTDEAEKLLAGVGDIVIAGELFAIPSQAAGRPRVHHVARALGEGDLAKTLGFRAFDLVQEGDEDWLSRSYADRFERMNSFLTGKRVSVVTTVEGDRSEAAGCFQEWVLTEKFEGLIARSSEANLTYKIKPSLTLDLVVLAFGERTVAKIGVIRELTVGLRRDDGSFHILGTVGTGFNDTDRMEWHARLAPLEVPSSFRMANREGTLCRFVRPEVVIEVKCSDLVATDASDNPVRRMTLSYDEEAGYAALGQMPIVSMLHPVFLRERTDKSTDAADVGLDQVYRYIPFDSRDEEPATSDLPRAEVVRRQAYTKTTKGSVAVRKYVALATHKADKDSNFPPYVVHFTDYSPGRKDPLQTNLRVAGTIESIDLHIEKWIEDNIKRGWKEAE